MKWKKKLIALAAAAMLSYPSFVNPAGGLNYTGSRYELNYKAKKYSAVRCSSIEDKVNGWCIENDKGRFVTERSDYYDLALMFEVERDSEMLESTINNTKDVFDTAFNIQLVMNASKFVMDTGAEIEPVLIRGLFGGGVSASQEVQRKIIKNAFKTQQKEVYSMAQDRLENILGGVKGLFDDFQQGKISEDEINKVRDKLKLDIRKMFGQCYEYQLKLASAELGKAQRLIQKKNKTNYEYQLIQDYTVDGFSRGFMATTFLNVINESRTFDKSINDILYHMGNGADLDAVLDLSSFAENPDLEKASQESERIYNEFYSRFSSNKAYWDLTDSDSNASRILPLIVEAQKRRDDIKEKKKIKPKVIKKESELKQGINYIDLNCDGTREKLDYLISGKPMYNLTINDNDNLTVRSCYPINLVSYQDCWYLIRIESGKYEDGMIDCTDLTTEFFKLDNGILINMKKVEEKEPKIIKEKIEEPLNFDVCQKDLTRIVLDFDCIYENGTTELLEARMDINYPLIIELFRDRNNQCTGNGGIGHYSIFCGTEQGGVEPVIVAEDRSMGTFIEDLGKAKEFSESLKIKKEPSNIQESKNEKVVLTADIDCSGYIGGGKYTYTNSGDGRGWCGGRGGNGHCLSNREDIVFDLRTSSCNMSGYYISANGKHIIVGDNSFSNLIYALKQAERGEY